MKIVQFITHMRELGGAQLHVLELSKELTRNGHEVVVVGSGTCELTEELAASGISYQQLSRLVVPIKVSWDVWTLFEFRRVMKGVNPDIIAIHSSKAGIIGRIVAKILHIPVIFTAHSWSFSGEPSSKKEAFYTFLERRAGKITNGVITVSDYDYQLALTKNIVPAEKLHLVHNGIPDTDHGFPAKQATNKPVKLLMVARFAEPKDHRLFLKALHQARLQQWELTFVGDGPLRRSMEQLAERLGIRRQVTFTGWDRNVTQRMKEADIFLLISKSEGLSLSIIEAMREGLPIIASDVGGTNELIEHGSQGFLVEKDDEQPLAAALDKLMGDADLREVLGKAARERFVAKFTFSTMYERTETYYREIAKK